MHRPKGSHGHYYSSEVYSLLRSCNAAVSAQMLILEVMEMQTTPHGAAQKVRYHLAVLRLKDSLAWLKKAQRHGGARALKALRREGNQTHETETS